MYMIPHADLVQRMCTVPGIDRVAAWTIIAEIGADMTPFPDAKHLASWAALCPGNNESAGKRRQQSVVPRTTMRGVRTTFTNGHSAPDGNRPLTGSQRLNFTPLDPFHPPLPPPAVGHSQQKKIFFRPRRAVITSTCTSRPQCRCLIQINGVILFNRESGRSHWRT
jgi:hypothetical protein